MLRLLFILSFLIVFKVNANVEDSQQALKFFLEATDAFEDERLKVAKTLASSAIALVKNDGVITDKPKLKFRKPRVGRFQSSITEIKGEKINYTPNQLLEQIKTRELQEFAFQQKHNKRAAPPIIKIENIRVIDTNDDNQISPYEDFNISFQVTNYGVSTAEDVDISMYISNLESVNHKVKINQLSSGETYVFNQHFQIKKQLNSPLDEYRLMIKVSELDDYGKVSDKTKLAIRPSFYPMIKFSLENEDQTLTVGRNKNLCYQVSNIGSETAYDLTLKLSIERGDTVKIVNGLDLKKIDQLNINDKRTACFKIRALSEASLHENLGLNLEYQYRGSEQKQFTLALAKVTNSVHNAAVSNNQEEHLYKFHNLVQGRTPKKSAALLVNYSQGRNLSKTNNIKLLSRVFNESLAIPNTNIFKHDKNVMGAWRSFFSGNRLKPKIVKQLVANKVETLHLYISGSGLYNTLLNETSLVIDSYQGEQILSIEHLLQGLSNIPVKEINLYLEVDFKAIQKQQLAFYPYRSLVKKLPKNINLFSAALRGQKTLVTEENKAELFTHFLAAGLTGKADLDHDANVSNSELARYLNENISDYARYNQNQSQIPWVEIGSQSIAVSYTEIL